MSWDSCGTLFTLRPLKPITVACLSSFNCLFVHSYNGEIVYGRLCNNPHSISVTLVILAKGTTVRQAQAVDGSLPAVMCSEKLIKYFMIQSFCSTFVKSLKSVLLFKATDTFHMCAVVTHGICMQLHCFL